ncbi:MAG: bifunctional acetate--CoA ligase family protein/GNAT family N-acetyltransferase [Hyphomicrobiaceae bacterium]|nr:bifunctional acetate--CoA ligase family protein/GNAT family N-acetyltransferase [Hyphomicrobiaceae bacterium]
MTIRNLGALLAPKSVALIGASDREGSVGNLLARNLARGGFRGRVDLVNPKGGEIVGLKCHVSVGALPETPDLAVIATPPATVPDLIAQLGARGCRAAVVITAGIRGELRQQMLNAARPHLLRIQGPNCLGLMLPPLGLDASFAHVMPPAGRLAFVSQSGALITGIVDWAQSRGVGFSHVVSIGDMADVDFGDLLDYLAGDAGSDSILLYMESLVSAAKFMSAARRAARAKPVVVIKAGRHAAGARAALSHTGRLAGADAAFEAAFRRAGLVRVKELSELFEAAEILSKVKPLEAERLGIITNGGGAGVLAADHLEDVGGELGQLSPETLARLDKALPATWSRGNPIDIIGDAGADRYEAAIEAALDEANFDAVLVINCPTALNPPIEAAQVTVDVLARRKASGERTKPAITNWLGETAAAPARRLFATHRVPTFDTPAAAIAGFSQLMRYRRAQAELMATPPSLPDGLFRRSDEAARVIAITLADGRRLLTEPEAKAVLAAYAIPTVPTHVAATPNAAAELARELLAGGGPVVLKILSRDISHKSDVGGVRLGLETPEAVETAARLMLERTRSALPDAVVDGFTVQPMIVRPHAHELLLGMSVDPVLGPLLAFGSGGVSVEAVHDVAHGLPPLDLNLARDMMRQTRIWRLLQGYRDRPPANVDEIALTLVRLGLLVAHHPEIREIDINPLIADEHGVVALDARITVEDEAAVPRAAMVIRPYPSEWETTVGVPQLGDVILRPIRPEDERLYPAFFAGVTPGDARLRFFSPTAEASHRFLARLTQIDYAREMAFIAIGTARHGEEPGLLGVARFIADPDFEQGEYAVLVRSDLKGRGLGWALMTHLISYARASGLGQIFGDILRDNTTMIAMCRELGFVIAVNPADTTLVRATLDLRRPAN